jgi:hypothetical protein
MVVVHVHKRLGSEDCIGSRPVLDDDGLLPALAERVRKGPRRYVHRNTRAKRRDDAD